jgi:GT2 family glycosyltransferase
MFKHVFLILNYNTKEMTCELANYIVAKGCRVVIVDNASIDDSFNYLRDAFDLVDDVFVVQTTSNLGFAGGNNFGYEFIINNFDDVEYLHCINSDILFDDFDCLINKINDDVGSYIIGPNVIHDDLRTSPLHVRDMNTIKETNLLDIKMYKNKVLKHKFGRLLGPFYKKYMIKNNSFIQSVDFPHYQHELTDTEYYVLNGCYLVFTRLYLDVFKQLFNPNTFLYCEEDILFYRMKKCGHKVSYYDDVKIIHLEGASSVDNIVFKYQQLKLSSVVFSRILGDK